MVSAPAGGAPPAKRLRTAEPMAPQAPTPSASAQPPSHAAGKPLSDQPTPAARKAELEALRVKLQAKEEQIRRKKELQAAREALAQAEKAELQAELQRRRAQLSKGFQALAAAGGDTQSGEGAGCATNPGMAVASIEDVQRVLAARSDYETLMVPVGCTAAEARKAYRRLAFSLHTDKCSEAGAQEAFIKVTQAYQALLKRSGQ